MIWNLIAPLAGKILDIVDEVVEDEDEANRLKYEIQTRLIQTHNAELEAAVKIIIAEAQGSWLQRNWRPGTMVLFLAMIVSWWFGYTPPNVSEALLQNLFEIFKWGLGGYVAGRSVEKAAKVWKG